MSSPTDIKFKQDTDGIYDLAVDSDERDWEMTSGVDSALLISLFSDARAYEDEIADPLLRRGTTIDLVSKVPDDRHGSTMWFWEQARSDKSEEIRQSAYDSLEWLQDERLITSRKVDVVAVPGTRTQQIEINLYLIAGGVIRKAFTLANATEAQTLADL